MCCLCAPRAFGEAEKCKVGAKGQKSVKCLISQRHNVKSKVLSPYRARGKCKSALN